EAVISAQVDSDAVRQIVTLLAPPRKKLGVPGRQTVTYGTELRFRVEAGDPLSASNLPAGASFDAASGDFAWSPAASQTGTYDLAFSAGGDTGHVIVDVGSGTPVVTALVNAATRSAEAVCSPRSMASIEGRWLAEGDDPASDASGASLRLLGAAVRVNGRFMPVLYAAPTRIDFLCPEAAPGSALEVAVETAAGMAASVRTTAREITPGVFSVDGSGRGQGLISHAAGSGLVMVRNYRYPSQPARSGDQITV